MDYIDDPTQLVTLMTSQGVENIDYIDGLEPLGGGTADNNYKGYIHWTDGTESKVQVKGSRTGDPAPASYREQLYYSRLLPISDVHTPYSYMAVADLVSA